MTDGKTRYAFAHAVNAFFELPTDDAKRILPAHLEPVELHHGTSIFAMTAFDFTESMVGPYGEVVMAVVVSPLASSAHPGSSGRPCSCASRSLPIATVLVATSKKNAGSPPAGATTARGLVPNRGSAP